MQITLLEAVKEYLDAVDGFAVDSIFETDEAQRAARICRRVFFRLFSTVDNLQSNGAFVRLEGNALLSKPVYARLPFETQRVQGSRIEYKNGTAYSPVQYLDPEDFMELTKGRSSTAEGAQVVQDYGGAEFVIWNNRQPQYYTSFDGEYVVFDSFDNTVSSTIVAAHARMYVTNEPVFNLDNNFVIPVPTHLVPVFLDNFIDEAALLMRNEALPRTAQFARVGRIKMQQDHRRVGSQGSKKTRFGRR